MATDSAAEKLNYIIFCLSRAGDVPINFEEVATSLKLRDSEEARAKFKKIVEESGRFKLDEDKVAGHEENKIAPAKADPVTPPVTAPPRTPWAPRKPSRRTKHRSNTSPSPRERKRQREAQNLSSDDSP